MAPANDDHLSCRAGDGVEESVGSRVHLLQREVGAGDGVLVPRANAVTDWSQHTKKLPFLEEKLLQGCSRQDAHGLGYVVGTFEQQAARKLKFKIP